MEYEVAAILGHRRRGQCLHWLPIMQGAPRHDAVWQPTRDFIGSDGTITEKLLEYAQTNNLRIPCFTVVADDN